MSVKYIEMTNGGVAMVNEDVYQFMNQFKWYRSSEGYPTMSRTGNGGIKHSVKMHHLVLGMEPGRTAVVDHINFVKMDNRRENLRICTQSQNSKHIPGWRNKKSSIYKGVFPRIGGKKWRVIVCCDKKRYSVGDFNSETEAAMAYNDAALKLFGEFAHLNDLKKAGEPILTGENHVASREA